MHEGENPSVFEIEPPKVDIKSMIDEELKPSSRDTESTRLAREAARKNFGPEKAKEMAVEVLVRIDNDSQEAGLRLVPRLMAEMAGFGLEPKQEECRKLLVQALTELRNTYAAAHGKGANIKKQLNTLDSVIAGL